MKKYILVLDALLLLVSSSGCLSDAEWEGVSEALGKWDDVRFPPHPVTRLTLSIDSVAQANDSTLTFWMHCRYDSVLIMWRYGLNYWETANAQTFRSTFEVRPDTIDFRRLKDFIYRYSVQVDSLKPDTYYGICTFVDHVTKSDTVRMSGSIYTTGCVAMKTN